MGISIPSAWPQNIANTAAQREIETLSILASGLPDDYTVYHAVHWTNVQGKYALYGEIDFAVINLAGDVLLIEQKCGFLHETADGLVKHYGGKQKPVIGQISRMVSAIRGKLAAYGDIPSVITDALLYCPDYLVKSPETAGLPPERIVDASRRDQLCQIIQTLLPCRRPSPATQKIHAFFSDFLELEPDVSALAGQAKKLITRISGGLAYWARQIELSPYRLRVIGTAGSGKSQLALAEYRAAINAGKRPLYVCYNRPLADHFSKIASAGGVVATFFQFCDLRLRHAGHTPDFGGVDAFEKLLEKAWALPVGETDLFDTLIVDEGQDFSEGWRDFLFRHLQPDARVLWLEDPMQNLYGKPPVVLEGWPILRAPSNYRSPHPVVRFLASILPKELRIEARGPVTEGEIEILTYSDNEGLLDAMKQAIQLCGNAGFKVDDMAVISYHGRERSRLMRLDTIGDTRLKHFSGRYDGAAQPVFTDGDVLLESVYRFKGQAAPAIIFTEIDFETLDEIAIRKLFVGATRAILKLVLILHEGSASALLSRMDNTD